MVFGNKVKQSTKEDIVYIFIKSGLSTYLFIGTQIEAYGTILGQSRKHVFAVGDDDGEEISAVRVDGHLVVPR